MPEKSGKTATPSGHAVSTWGAVGVLLALLATVGFLDGMVVLWVRAEERARVRLDQERHGGE
jgi:uncharacterized membrane protein YbaN (DUF454 family)